MHMGIDSVMTSISDMKVLESAWPRIDKIPGFFSPEEARLLYAAARWSNETFLGRYPMMEVGAFQGKSTNVLGLVAPVIIVEPSYLWHEPTLDGASWDGTSSRGFEYVEFKPDLYSRSRLIENTRNISCVLLPIPSKDVHLTMNVSMIFIDGNHTSGGVDIDAAKFLPLVPYSGMAAFHDYGTDYPLVTNTVDELLNNGWSWCAQDGSLVILQRN